MFLRLFWTASFALLTVQVALAQDPTKVEPRHYKLDFENERVQVVSVHYGPHQKSALHDHPGGVVVVLTGGHLRFTDQNGKTQEVFAKPGEARWFPPFKHRVENLGDTAYDAVYVGIKGKLATASGPKDGLDQETTSLLSAYLNGNEALMTNSICVGAVEGGCQYALMPGRISVAHRMLPANWGR